MGGISTPPLPPVPTMPAPNDPAADAADRAAQAQLMGLKGREATDLSGYNGGQNAQSNQNQGTSYINDVLGKTVSHAHLRFGRLTSAAASRADGLLTILLAASLSISSSGTATARMRH